MREARSFFLPAYRLALRCFFLVVVIRLLLFLAESFFAISPSRVLDVLFFHGLRGLHALFVTNLYHAPLGVHVM